MVSDADIKRKVCLHIHRLLAAQGMWQVAGGKQKDGGYAASSPNVEWIDSQC